jgi:hypothetical protein
MLETKFEEMTPIQLEETKGLIIDFLVIQRVILIHYSHPGNSSQLHVFS